MGNNENKIILYPSNWLYNAGVVGFIRVLESDRKINGNLFDGSNIVINREWIKESYELIFEYHEKKLNEKFSIWGKNKRYPNYIQPKQKEFFKNIFVPSLVNVVDKQSGKTCNWCKGYFLSSNILENLKKEWIRIRTSQGKKSSTKIKGDESFNNFIRQREVFQGIHIKELGGAITEMPNSFWNLDFSTPICHLCSYLIIFHHLAFLKVEKNYEVFINTPHFHLTWDLNKFAEEILKGQKESQIRKLFGTSLTQWAMKRRALLGAWTMMNIEVIIKKWHKEEKKWIIDYFDLPYHITKILLDWEIADLINRIGEEKIFDLVLNGKFSELEKANYFVLKAILKLKNNEKLSDNDPVTKYINDYKNESHLLKISNLLPELYAKIIKILKTEVKYG